jgi:hypothetical protein
MQPTGFLKYILIYYYLIILWLGKTKKAEFLFPGDTPPPPGKPEQNNIQQSINLTNIQQVQLSWQLQAVSWHTAAGSGTAATTSWVTFASDQWSSKQ